MFSKLLHWMPAFSTQNKVNYEISPLPEFYLNDIKINNQTLPEAVRWIVSQHEKQCKTVNFVNANSINLSFKDKTFVSCLNNADKIYADGIGVKIAANRFGVELVDNVNGTDLLPVLCQQMKQRGKRLFLYGAKPGVAKRMQEQLKEKFPGLDIVGAMHGFHSEENARSIIDTINNSQCDILLVALGSPIQEAWLSRYRHLLKVDVAVSVGGLFDFYSGDIPRAPLWMRKRGLEWLFRLCCEPRVKFSRYVLGVPEFLWRLYASKQIKSRG